MIRFERDRTMIRIPPDDAATGDRPPPAILFLHGVGERGAGGEELAKVACWGLPKLRRKGRRLTESAFPFLVIAPQCPPEYTWCDEPVLGALDRLLDETVERGDCDPAQIFISGFSMGGIGSYCVALRHPQRFAALASVCGLCSEPDRLDELAHLPLWVAYGEDDEITRLTEGSKLVVARLSANGHLVERRFRVGRSGDVGAHPRTADAAYAEPELYAWLREHRLTGQPAG